MLDIGVSGSDLTVRYYVCLDAGTRVDVFAQGADEARHDDWTIADDGSLYTLPLRSESILTSPDVLGDPPQQEARPM